MIDAERLVGELMLVSVLVAGDGAAELVAALDTAGAAADVFPGAGDADGFDLAILLAQPGTAGLPQTRGLVDGLARASDRVLLAPLPLGVAVGGGPALPDLPAWFELFAELGYQPVVEFDAGFVSAGAFLVDRAATAAESDLAAFADRLQLGPEAASMQREAVQEAERNVRSELQAARAVVSERDAALARMGAELTGVRGELTEMAAHAAGLAAAARDAQAAAHASVEAALQDAEQRNAGWDGLRGWVRVEVADVARNAEALLRRDLPRLNALRAPDLPPVALADAEARQRGLRRLWPRRRAAAPGQLALLDAAAMVRACPLFDAAWYVAANPDAFSAGLLDPVFHYLLVGGPRAADPGPWFEAGAYVREHPQSAENPLLHAIRSGAVEKVSL